jgi:hypothetical protein
MLIDCLVKPRVEGNPYLLLCLVISVSTHAASGEDLKDAQITVVNAAEPRSRHCRPLMTVVLYGDKHSVH